jgi:hypothetical protein
MQAVQAIQATEESHADKGMRSRIFCFVCGDVPHCPSCLLQGERILLSFDQQSDLYDAVYRQKAGAYTYPQQRLSFTKQQLADVMEEFRVLLREYTPWYDNTSRRMIQACYQNLCIRGGTSNKVALAIHFFEGEFARASEMDA